MADAANWAHELPAPTKHHLAGLLDFADVIPASARPTPLTVTAGARPVAADITSAALLQQAGAGVVGLLAVSVAERPHPLWLRAGTDDFLAAQKSLAPHGGIKIPFAPRRILELGAGAGYRSVALALAHPGAEILSTEADAAFQRTALLNTLAYKNIACGFLAASTDAARYSFAGRSGEAGYPTLVADPAGSLAATPLKNFLHARAWNVFDVVIITPDAASDHLLRAPWPKSVRLLAIETGGAALHSATAACFPEAAFLTTIEGDYVLLHRRAVDAAPSPLRPTAVFCPDSAAQKLIVQNVAANPPGFFSFGAQSFRLHPNASGAPAACVRVTAVCANFNALQLTLRSGLKTAQKIRFAIKILARPAGDTLLDHVEMLDGGETRTIAAKLPPYSGAAEVVFSTEMAVFGDSNAGAWAEFLSADFV
jgi:hypothetical protein